MVWLFWIFKFSFAFIEKQKNLFSLTSFV